VGIYNLLRVKIDLEWILVLYLWLELVESLIKEKEKRAVLHPKRQQAQVNFYAPKQTRTTITNLRQRPRRQPSNDTR
jgi:hypothetical protein